MIDKDKCQFPFKTVSFYLNYLLENKLIDYFDDHIEDYNNILLDFERECNSHFTRMKILKYVVAKMMEKDNIVNPFEYFKKSLKSNLDKIEKIKYEKKLEKISEQNKKNHTTDDDFDEDDMYKWW